MAEGDSMMMMMMMMMMMGFRFVLGLAFPGLNLGMGEILHQLRLVAYHIM